MLRKASTVLAVLLLGGIVGLTSVPAAPQALDAFGSQSAIVCCRSRI
jgi:hypothetical protein